MKYLSSVCAFGAVGLILAGCGGGGPSGELGGRELRPPRAGIKVGSLYYVKEAPNAESDSPANLIRLCDFNLADFQISPETQPVADIDLLKKFEISGGLEGVKTKAVELGLSGNISRYYTYKLTNVSQSDISYAEAGSVFDKSAFGPNCSKWRNNIAQENWGMYQVQNVKVGDIVFERKNSAGLSASVKAKLQVIEPELKSTLQNNYEAKLSGKQLVVSFEPIDRS